MVNTLCLCIDTSGEVYQSNTFEENLERLQDPVDFSDPEDLFEPACSSGGTPVINASDYLHNFFGFCNAYANEA